MQWVADSPFISAPSGVLPSPNFAQERSSLEAPAVVKKKKRVTKQNAVKVRKEFPETWLWAELSNFRV